MITSFFAILSSIAYLLITTNPKIKRISIYCLGFALANFAISAILFQMADSGKLINQWYTSSFIFDITGLVIMILPGIYSIKQKYQN
jgi:hypothetical protein